MKKIVVPTDFSVHAENAYPVAAQIARKYDTGIVLYHILNPSIEKILTYAAGFLPDSDIVPETGDLENFINKKLEEVKNAPVFEGVEVEYVYDKFMDNNTGEEIADFINKNNVYMVVMGNAGAIGHKETCADIVTRLSKLPVISVKGEVGEYDVNRILLMTDFHEIDSSFINKVRVLQSQFDAELHIGYINLLNHFKETSELDDMFSDMRDQFKLNNPTFHVYNSRHLEHGIIHLARKIDADILSLITHGRKGMSHFINGSHTEDLINHINIPVLVYNEHDYLKHLHSINDSSYGQHAYTRGFSG